MNSNCLDLLTDLGGAIKLVRFNKLPRRDVLEVLMEGENDIFYDFSDAGCIGRVYDVISFANQITHATLETDLEDSGYFENFINMEYLTLVCVSNDYEGGDAKMLGDMQQAILNLPKLKELVLDVRYISAGLARDVESYIKFPWHEINFSIIKQ